MTFPNEERTGRTALEVLAHYAGLHPGKVAFSTSLGAEDQVITHLIFENRLPIRIFTLDTGRLFPETYELLDITVKKYGIPIEVFFPDADEVQKMVTGKGINLFYDSVENRKQCCHIRKTLSLSRALAGMEVWVTGMRREQSATRTGIRIAEPDGRTGLLKVQPLIGWTEKEVWDYIREHKVPYNPLHDKGFPSIGCQPCTRAVLPGEHIRAGRWWWEDENNRECGIHK